MVVAFQHYLVMLGTTVIIATILVPIMGGGHVSLIFHPFRPVMVPLCSSS